MCRSPPRRHPLLQLSLADRGLDPRMRATPRTRRTPTPTDVMTGVVQLSRAQYWLTATAPETIPATRVLTPIKTGPTASNVCGSTETCESRSSANHAFASRSRREMIQRPGSNAKSTNRSSTNPRSATTSPALPIPEILHTRPILDGMLDNEETTR